MQIDLEPPRAGRRAISVARTLRLDANASSRVVDMACRTMERVQPPRAARRANSVARTLRLDANVSPRGVDVVESNDRTANT